MLSIGASGKAPDPPHSELFGGLRATPPGHRGAALLDADFVNGLLGWSFAIPRAFRRVSEA